MNQDSYNQTIEKVGSGIKRKLEAQFNQWGNGIEYRRLFNGYSVVAKKLGVDLATFAYDIESHGFIKIYNTPKGKAVVYASTCPLNSEQIDAQLLQMELNKNEKSNDKTTRNKPTKAEKVG